MCKSPITRQELSAKVLAEIREHPKCGSVKEIAITPVKILDEGTTWHVNVIDPGGADVKLALIVAWKIQENLSPLLEVID